MPRHDRRTLPTALLVLVGGVLLLGACADRGRDLRPPLDSQTTTTAAPDGGEHARPPGAQAGADGFTVRVEGVAPGGPLPVRATCDGEDEPPVLLWQNVPDDAQELAVAMVSADGVVHWLVVGIDAALAGMDGADLPPGARALLADDGVSGWSGPCPAEGSEGSYVFTLYALAEATAFDPMADPDDVRSDLAGSSLAVATQAVTFPGDAAGEEAG